MTLLVHALRDPGVSYLFRINLGSLLFDAGFGGQNRKLAYNAAKLGVSIDRVGRHSSILMGNLFGYFEKKGNKWMG